MMVLEWNDTDTSSVVILLEITWATNNQFIDIYIITDEAKLMDNVVHRCSCL